MRKIYISYILFLLIAILLTTFSLIKLEAQEYEFREVANNLEVIWEMRVGPDNQIWLTERPGRVQKVNLETGEKTLLLDITEDVLSDDHSERGLMGMALSPNFENNPYVFLSYNYESSEGTKVKIVRYTYNGSKLVEPTIILNDIRGATNHDGCRLEFDDKGKLYITTGDAAQTSLPQNRNNINGKILRLNPDGTIPKDNPYFGMDNNYREEVWSFGHRNPQGLVFHNGIMYSSEHGPSTNDELNIIEKDRNYGWPQVKGFCDESGEMSFCEENNVHEPMAVFNKNSTLAVAGIDFYNVPDSAPYKIDGWQNSILMVTLKTGLLLQLKLSPDGKEIVSQNTIIDDDYGRLRAVRVLPDGSVIVGTSNKDGRGDIQTNDDKIILITPKKTDVDNQDRGELFEIYPNPSSNDIYIKSNDNERTIVSIFDILGSKIAQYVAMPYSTKKLDMSNLPTGQYNVQFMSKGRLAYKILKIIN